MSVAIVAAKDSIDIVGILKRSPVASVPNAERTLRRWLKASNETWFGMHDGEVACIWGLAPPSTISDRAYLWLLTTDLVEQHKFLFVRHSQVAIEDALKRYSKIVGHVEVGNTSARRWLKWLGADIGPPEGKFSPFVIRRKEWSTQSQWE
jgi:hypothetical protein